MTANQLYLVWGDLAERLSGEDLREDEIRAMGQIEDLLYMNGELEAEETFEEKRVFA